MNGVAIYMEGGGDRAGGKKALRQGMDALLVPIKAMASDRGWRWKLVPSGGRHRAFCAYRNAVRANEYAVVVLLVDSEYPVSAPPVHLARLEPKVVRQRCPHFGRMWDWLQGRVRA